MVGKIGEFKKFRVQFWTEGRKLLSVRVIGSFEIAKVRESGIPVSKFLAPVQAVVDLYIEIFDTLTLLNAFLGFVVNDN